MADPRLHSIYFHAGRLFNTKRYANTKVSEIAVASGIATGTVYNLFKNKKAILTFVIKASFDKAYLNSDITLPIQEVKNEEMMALYNSKVKGFLQDIAFDGQKLNCSFIQLISATFDMNADTLLGTGNIETNADELPELASLFFALRDRFFSMVESALRRYMAEGEIRDLEFPRVHVQSIMDILTWWAMNAYIAMPDVSVPRETARKIAVDLLERAYLTDMYRA